MPGEERDPGPAPGPCGRMPLRLVGLGLLTTCSARARLGPLPSRPPLRRLMLAEPPSPHASGARRVTVGTVSAGSVRGVTFPHRCVGYC
jgi:hypothetical protein